MFQFNQFMVTDMVKKVAYSSSKILSKIAK